MRAILILHPFGAALSLQSIKAVVLETRERLDAQARAKMDFCLESISKLYRFLLRRPARYFLRFPIFRSEIEEESKKNRQGLG